MGPIRDINNLPPEFRRLRDNQSVANHTTNVKQAEKQGTTESSRPDSNTAAHVNISSTARSLLQRMEGVESYLQALKESDSAEVAHINKAITSGKYNTPESLKKIAEGIMANPEFKQILTERFEALQKRRENPHHLSNEEIQAVRAKIQSGYYEQPQVVESIAGKILRPSA
ncbi:MAG TPA: hypothetical protein DHU63_09870 [Candidatus Marinimicrobia bacterium]|nr:hypothetical protein [Candidatus Neomarinimicrobiota bacterium]